MKMRNVVKALSSALLAGVLVVSACGMTASAETVNSVTLTKNVSAGTGVLAPETSFSFAIAPAIVADGTKDSNNKPVYSGVAGGAFFADGADTISFTAGGDMSKTTAVSLSASVFERPGIYRYVITETEGSYDGMDYSEDSYYLDVYVTNGTAGLEVTGTVVLKDGAKADSLAFTNTYTTNKLSVTKKIAGNQAYMDGKWDITIKVDGASGEKYATNKNGVTLTSGASATVSLGHDETIEIYGLSAGDTYTVVEDEANTDGYTTTYKVNNTDAASVSAVAEGTSDNTVVITNTKEVTTPTGIVLTFAPYLAMIAAAVILAVVFLRRRREDV